MTRARPAGTARASPTTISVMTCAECREALSARLDDEESPREPVEVEVHLVGCPECRRYAERAAHVTRLARTELVEPVPDLVDAVRHAIPGPGWCASRRETALRVLLAAVGVGQLGLGTSDVLAAGAENGGHGVDGATLTHFSHESSAWNLALAVGFLCVAARPVRIRGMLPLVGAFVGVLTALSAVDLALHRVAGSRLLSHGLVVLGLLALVVLARVAAAPSDGTPRALRGPSAGGPGGSPRGHGAPRSAAPGAGGAAGLNPTARHHAA
jgi:predicted anti-sigma-YlaC factor YlaD